MSCHLCCAALVPCQLMRVVVGCAHAMALDATPPPTPFLAVRSTAISGLRVRTSWGQLRRLLAGKC